MKAAVMLTLGLLALPAVAGAQALETRQVPVEKAFPFLKDYYALKKHDGFRLDFILAGAAPPPSFRMVLKRKGGDVPIAVAADHRFLPLPEAQDFAAGTPLEVTAPKGLKIALSVKISSTLSPARTMDARALAAGVDQVRTGIKSMAGMMALLVPDYKSVCFDGAKNGTVTLPGGKSAALKLSNKPGDAAVGSPCFTPSDYPSATEVTLDRVPSGVYIEPRTP